MLFLAAAWLGLVSSAIAIPIDMVTLPDVKPAFTVEQATDYYLYNVTMDAFVAARIVRSGTDLGLNWTSNGCSVAPNDPFGFDFFKSCARHDFGYRNYKQQGRCGTEQKSILDWNFWTDMYTQCACEKEVSKREVCERVADAYYASVRVFGRVHFCNFES